METEPLQALDGFPYVVPLPIQWGDQDAFGHVNNVVYLRWFETARIGYCERVGLAGTPTSGPIAPILASVTCHFRRQLTYPDTIQVAARITRIGRSSLTMEHRIVSAAAGAIAAEGDSTLVVFNYSEQKSVPLPAEIRRAIETLEGRTFD